MKSILRGQLPASSLRGPRSAADIQVRVLFVCQANACRSQMAEAFANHYGSDVLRAESAGIRPAPRLPWSTSTIMREKGLDIAGRTPKGFDRFPIERFDLVVNLSGCLLPHAGSVPALNIDVPDPIGHDEQFLRQVRDRIERLVLRLVGDLRSACSRHARRGATAPPAFAQRASAIC
jgi:arsenate reductase